ncbi:MAG: class II fructose-bisphosphate aldolase [Sphaerochaeta sp.]|nr:class II fructose-bisphosphate aldolase [Sphaerochaeta sp.]
MALVTLKYALERAKEGNYAVGAFNFFNLENLKGVIEAASLTKSPVIAMASVGAMKIMGEKLVVAATRAISEEYGTEVVLHLDHATDYDMICRCIDNGFTSVMIDASQKSFEENVQITRKVVDYARKYGVSVEAELGHVGGVEDHIKVDERSALFTVPNEAKVFVEETGIDALAVAVGTVHGFYKSEPKIDFDRIAAIRKLTDLPLVLHGGTGVSDVDLRRAIEAGITKINVGTELKVHGLFDVMKAGSNASTDSEPRTISKMMIAACSQIVQNKIKVFGSEGKLDN